MHLSPAEEEILEENYEITMVGHDNYYRRKNVMKFFSDFSMTSNLENVLPTVEIKEANIKIKGVYVEQNKK